MGLDIGRKYTGIALTDSKIQTVKPYKTIVGDGQYGQGTYSLFKNNSIFGEIRKIIMRKKVKGIVVGYPLNEKGET